MLTVQDLSKSFSSRTLWEGVNFSLEPGEMAALTGVSGSGKSTLLNCIGTLEPWDAGSVTIGDVEMGPRRRGARRVRRDTLGFVFQDYALIDNARVADNLGIAHSVASPKGWDPSDALDRVGLGGREEELVRTLSGGEQQRVALARLLVKGPRLVLADEPTGALDADNTRLVIEVLTDMADRGAAVLVATHSESVAGACHRVLEVGQGSVREARAGQRPVSAA